MSIWHAYLTDQQQHELWHWSDDRIDRIICYISVSIHWQVFRMCTWTKEQSRCFLSCYSKWVLNGHLLIRTNKQTNAINTQWSTHHSPRDDSKCTSDVIYFVLWLQLAHCAIVYRERWLCRLSTFVGDIWTWMNMHTTNVKRWFSRCFCSAFLFCQSDSTWVALSVDSWQHTHTDKLHSGKHTQRKYMVALKVCSGTIL